MEKNLNDTRERRPYIKPEATEITLCLNENIAFSGDEFDGEDDVFD